MERIEDTGRALVVTIDGEEYDNLRRVVDVLNTTDWTGEKDMTPARLLKVWILDLADEDLHNPAHLAESILDGVATDDEGITAAPEPLHSQRLALLRAAFVRAGILK